MFWLKYFFQKQNKNEYGKTVFIYLSNFPRKLQENSYIPEYSGISLILSIERVSPEQSSSIDTKLWKSACRNHSFPYEKKQFHRAKFQHRYETLDKRVQESRIWQYIMQMPLATQLSGKIPNQKLQLRYLDSEVVRNFLCPMRRIFFKSLLMMDSFYVQFSTAIQVYHKKE